MKNQEIARIFYEIADILEIKGENPFRIRAYRRAAQAIDGLARDVTGMDETGLKKIPGIGSDLAGKILEYAEAGRLEFYEELRKETPQGLVEMLSVPGLGPKTAKMLFEKLNISDIGTLEGAAAKGRLRGLPGIQKKTEENILKGIAMIKRWSGRYAIGRVLPVAEDLLKGLEKAPVKELSLAGSLRRWKDTIKDIDIVATSRNPREVIRVFTGLPQVREVLMKGPTKSSAITREGIQADLRVVEEGSFGAALAYFTGSKAHNIRLRGMAVRMGLKINEYGVFTVKTGKKIGGRKEADVYRALGIAFIPPELREDAGEIEAAIAGNLPEPVEFGDVKGDLHVHTSCSDGGHGLEEVVEAARQRGYGYIAITDHSKSLGIAGGMSVKQVLEQNKKIHALNRRLKGFKILTGIEVDIKSDGTLDYPDELLKRLDVVVAAIHSGFGQPAEQITKRLVSAMKNPFVSIIAHPTGRLIGERDAYEVRMEDVLDTARDSGTAIEINAYPLRLDLSDIYARKAKEAGVRLAVSTDMHVLSQFDFMRYGIGIARRGWLEKRDVLNTRTHRGLLKHLGLKRRGFGHYER